MHIAVLGGCGDMGSHVVQDLLSHSNATVTIADYRVTEAQRRATRLDDPPRPAVRGDDERQRRTPPCSTYDTFVNTPTR